MTEKGEKSTTYACLTGAASRSGGAAGALLACLVALVALAPPAHAQSLPEIGVSATQEFVVEGEVIEFRLAAEPALPAPVTLRYRVAQSVGGDVLAAAEMRASGAEEFRFALSAR